MVSNLLDESIQKNLVNKFNELIEYVMQSSPYYSELYNKMDPKLNSLEDLINIPYTLRKDLYEFYPFGYLCKSKGKLPAYFETSGSTGNPIPVFPDLSTEKTENFAKFLDYWMGIKKSRIDLAIVALPYEMNPMGLKYHSALISLGVTVIPASVRTTLCSPKKLISLIQNLKPGLLIGRPMEIMRYAEGMQLMGIDPKECSIRKIFLTGETMSNAKWERIQELYGGVEIYSTYGLTELDTGLISCSKHHYHLPNSANLIVEIVNDKGEYVGENETGEVIITTLEKGFAPLIRYKTEDIGKFHTNCDCYEFNTPYIELLGRKADRKEYNNTTVFPKDIENILLSDSNIGCEYQMIINDKKLIIKAEKAYGCELNNEEIKNILKNKIEILGINPEIEILEFNSIADKFGIAKTKGCRFFDISGMDEKTAEKALKINICNGEDLN